MGSLILELILQQLKEAGFRAELAYPGRKMTQIAGVVAAVHVKKMDPVRAAMTVAVIIAAPEKLGGAACELEALRAMEVLGRTGAVCVQNGCSYESRGQIYTVEILAEYAGGLGVDPCALGPGIRVYVGDEAANYAVAFTAEKESSPRVMHEMGARDAADVSLGPWVWKLRLEELMPMGIIGFAQPQEGFTLRVRGLQGEEVFTDCCWSSARYEYTPMGVRRIRSGYALSREEVSWTS